MPSPRQTYLFVTGKLAARALTDVLRAMEPDFDYEIRILNSTVAALMNTGWIADRLGEVGGFDSIVVPGRCHGDVEAIEEKTGVKVLRGPDDLNDLPRYFGKAGAPPDLSKYRTRILAEIVDAYRIGLDAILARAAYYRNSGADFIDLGCPPSGGFSGVGEAVAALKAKGCRVSVDTFDRETILEADKAGVDMLLSVNSANLEVAREIGAKVVVIPDFGKGLDSLEHNAARLAEWGVRYVLDPILDPIGFGFTDSVARFRDVRRNHPEAEMLMGLGNLSELTHADTTGINAVLAGVLAELNIDYVLTTEVAPHATGAVRELDRARRMMHYAVGNRVLPVNLTDDLLTVKDAVRPEFDDEELAAIHAQVKDRNFRIFVSRGEVVVFNRDVFLRGTDAQALYEAMGVDAPGHAYYIGRELERAVTAARLGKRYVQDNPLHYGYLSEPGKA
jgi:dihydropteroate synthase-like protein